MMAAGVFGMNDFDSDVEFRVRVLVRIDENRCGDPDGCFVSHVGFYIDLANTCWKTLFFPFFGRLLYVQFIILFYFQITMNLSKKGVPNNVTKLNTANKSTNLNPNAAEFVPFALRSSPGSSSIGEVTARLETSGISGKAVLDRTESTVSDEEAHQYWRRQLPDDITPDFKFMGEDESQGPGSLPFASLSILDGSETSLFSASTSSGQIMSKQQELSSHGTGNNSLFEKMKYSVSPYVEDQSSAGFLNLPTNPWDKQTVNNDQNLGVGKEGFPYNGNSNAGFVDDMFSENANFDGSEVSPVDFLASNFPGFAAESLAEVYYANGCDLNLTIEMLTQLELQVDGGFGQNMNSKALSAPNLSAMDFPALSEAESQNGLPKYAGDDIQQITSPYRSMDKENILFFRSSSSSAAPRGAVDFASAVKKLASQDSGQWKYERNGSANATIGSSRSSHVLASSYSGGHGKPIFGDRLQNYGAARGAPAWLETGEAVANMYSELREEARDHARLRNAYFEQARQAYLIGNKALAKDLSVKGQLHNMHMKAAHEKAQESIYRQRNPDVQGYGRGQERMIDLHGLHVSEAIHRLRSELNVLRSAARNADHPLQVYICVGTGHHTKGSRTPARLPVAVEQYLLQEEGLEYTEPQPGLLRVVIY
ncbi:Smr protein/MutS2 C-terminal [Macleaya cordata]|uniref:Smr protein/MutS2 C-terminal n=1 Tax=Macleaya cordata TaxID=56857 RepID=A0A200PT89_MACCD|nr:Smr protein/MutS2 C-terminal [Macleaya cordata]